MTAGMGSLFLNRVNIYRGSAPAVELVEKCSFNSKNEVRFW